MVKPLSIISTISVFLPQALSHSFIIALDGANGVQSTGFGTRLTTRGMVHQYTGIITDKEIRAGTVGPCGRIFGGDNFPPFVLDPHAELARAEASGISTVHKDGSIVMGMFVHNPDGSGPFTCDYSSDATLSSFYPMNVTVQIEGVDGVNPAAHNYVYPLTAAFYPNATCTGGKGKDTCIVRCRNQLGFGSCVALKLGEAAQRAKPLAPSNATNVANHADAAAKNETHPAAPAPHEPVSPANPPKAPVPAPATPAPVPPPPPAAAPKSEAVKDAAPAPKTPILGPNPDAFRIYNSGAPPYQPPVPTTPLVISPDGVSNRPPPHDPNYNPLQADIPSSPPGVEGGSQPPKFKRAFLHKRSRRHL